MCHVSFVICQVFFFVDKVLEKVGEGLLSTRPTPSSFILILLPHFGPTPVPAPTIRKDVV